MALLFLASHAAAQDRSVSGTVIDARSLRPLEGVEIRVIGTSLQTKTDAVGHFVLRNLSGTQVTLELRWLGYRPFTKVVPVGEHALQISLIEVAVELDALVVTGTPGATEARAVGNAVSRTKVADVLQGAPVTDVQSVLAARVPGVTITQTQGNVGSGAVIRIRGVSSMFLPNDPLVYIDGARMDNNPRAGPYIRGGPQVSRLGDLVPEEIEAIEVIKGPAAGTLYGTEASRGVIQIITQRGVPGPTRFGFTVRYGANWFPKPAERLNLIFGLDSTGQLDSVNLYQREVDAGRPIFSTGQPRSYTMNMNGGTEAVRYFASATYGHDEGVVPYDWRDRVSARANFTMVPTDRLNIETSVALVRNDMRLGQMTSPGAEVGWDAMTQLNWGSLSSLNSDLRGFTRATPEDITVIESRASTYRVMASVQIQNRPARWFDHRLNTGADVSNETSSLFFPSDTAGSRGPFQTLSQGDKTVNGNQAALLSFDYVANFKAALAADLQSTTSVGTQYYHKRLETTEQHGHGFPVGVSAISGAAQTTSEGDVIENKGVGVFAQEQLGWKNRRFVTAAVRVDDHSAFGTNFDVVTYPKVSASWVISEERFWGLNFFDALKLRAAWGLAGRQPDAFAAERTYLPVSGPGGTSALTPQNVGNPDLKPERGQELEVGFDAGLFDDRVAASLTYYRQTIKDAIAPRALAPSEGFSGNQLVNLGLVSNSGFEASLDARLVDAPGFVWELGASFATNDSRIESLGGLDDIWLAATGIASNANFVGGQWHRQGYPVGAYFLPLVLNVTLDTNRNIVGMQCSSGPDNGHQPVVCDSLTPRLFAGRPTPAWEGSVRSSIAFFRNLRLTGLVDFRGGHVSWIWTTFNAHSVIGNTRSINQRSDPMLLAYDSLYRAGVLGASQRLGLLNGGFAKLREVSLTYTLPPAWAARFGGASASITVAGRNLAILWAAQREIYGFKIADPEARSPIDLSGAVNNLMPPYAQFITTVRVTF